MIACTRNMTRVCLPRIRKINWNVQNPKCVVSVFEGTINTGKICDDHLERLRVNGKKMKPVTCCSVVCCWLPFPFTTAPSPLMEEQSMRHMQGSMHLSFTIWSDQQKGYEAPKRRYKVCPATSINIQPFSHESSHVLSPVWFLARIQLWHSLLIIFTIPALIHKSGCFGNATKLFRAI